MAHSEFYSESEWNGVGVEANDHIFLILYDCKMCEKCDFFLKARFKIMVYVIEITE